MSEVPLHLQGAPYALNKSRLRKRIMIISEHNLLHNWFTLVILKQMCCNWPDANIILIDFRSDNARWV